jgi:hypothetical protein
MKILNPKLKYESGWYMMPTSSPKVLDYPDLFGSIESPRTYKDRATLRSGFIWCMDNDAFNSGFDLYSWGRALIRKSKYKSTCLFVVCPDVYADSVETLKKFKMFEPMLHRRDWPVALVTQDGMLPEDVPWSKIECLFIGGSDEHKLGREAGRLIACARDKNKWVHVGRVNSRTRLMKFISADSWDGTNPIYAPNELIPKYASWIREIRALKKNRFEL